MILSQFLLVFALIAPTFFTMGDSSSSSGEYLELSTVTGYFQQDDPGTSFKDFDFTKNDFGLIKRPYESDVYFDPDLNKTQWQRFEAEVDRLNIQSDTKTRYKVLYMGRHGEGYHNVAESFYGTRSWDCYWSLKNGNETTTWLDAELTPLGISQAQTAHKFWANMIETEKIPLPQVYYVSPLFRSQQTAWYTFFGLNLTAERPFKPVIKELLRESIGVHTCDLRSPKSTIQMRYPEWIIEDGFTEKDELWHPTLRETTKAIDQRAKIVFDDILANDKHTFISISSHSGQISSALRGKYFTTYKIRTDTLSVLGHRSFQLNTGQVIPVLVKIVHVPGLIMTVKKEPWITPEICASPPQPV